MPSVVYYKNHKEGIKRRASEYYYRHKDEYDNRSRKYGYNCKLLVINHYGGKCENCGIDDIDLLTIDHVNNDGAKHRQSIKCSGGHVLYRWLIKNNFPVGFQILCWNCNIKKYMNMLRRNQ